MKTIAITVFGDRVSSRLDCSEHVLLATADDETITEQEQVRLVQNNPLEKINMLNKLGVDVLICGGVTEIYANKLKDMGIEVIPWMRGDAQKILSEFLGGTLTEQDRRVGK